MRGVREASGTRIAVRLKHAEIASLVGSTRETVSVELGRLLRTGRLILEDGYYVLPESAQEALAAH